MIGEAVVDLRMFARLGGVAFIAVAMIATTIEIREDDALRVRPARAENLARNALAAELARCKALGASAASDAACRQAWMEHRRRFFAPAEPAPQPTPANLFPTSPEIQPQPQSASRKDQSRLENGPALLFSRPDDAKNSSEPGNE